MQVYGLDFRARAVRSPICKSGRGEDGIAVSLRCSPEQFLLPLPPVYQQKDDWEEVPSEFLSNLEGMAAYFYNLGFADAGRGVGEAVC